MIKVGPITSSSETVDRSWVTMVIRRCDPSDNNRIIGAMLAGKPPPASFAPKRLSDMICKLWRGMGAHKDAVKEYQKDRSQYEHAWLVGVRDPYPGGCLPP